MGSSKILIIDDDIDDVEILADAFTQSGMDNSHYELTATKAMDYLEQCIENNELPGLIVTDVYLPGIDGTTLVQELKQTDRYKNIDIVVLSSIKKEEDVEKYKQLGAIDYLEKPSSYDQYLKLASYIKERLSGSIVSLLCYSIVEWLN